MPDPIYSVLNHGQLVADSVRMSAYDEALRTACHPGCRVLDIGTGPGMFALLACRYSAGHVYAVETSHVIELAREIAAANGLADRITFIQGRSTEIVLAEPMDVVVADVRGVLPMTGGSLVTMADGRRFLGPSGVLIPTQDRIRGALVESERALAPCVEPWRAQSRGFDLSAAERVTRNVWLKVSLGRDTLLTEPRDLCTLDYRTLAGPNVHGTCTTTVMRKGTAHGFAAWFDTTLFGEHGYSNEPGQPKAIYGQAFFPLEESVAVDIDDDVTLGLRATFLDGDYVWSWEITVRTAATGVITHRSVRSTFHAQVLSPEALQRADPSARLQLNDTGKADRLILDRIDDGETLAAIAEDLVRVFPAHFRSVASALGHIASLTTGRCTA